MRIVWVTDYNPFSEVGGGALSDKACIVSGMRAGHTIDIFPSEMLGTAGIANYDLMVVSNAFKLDPRLLIQASKVLPYVMYLHDYWPLCTYHLFYPMTEKCKACSNIQFTRELVLNSKLNIFLSPLHREAWSYAIPELKEHEHYLHVSPVDTELFKVYEGVNRIPNSVLMVNSLLDYKGAENTMKYIQEHPQTTFTYIGGRDEKYPLPANVGEYGFVAPSTLPEFYSQAESFLFLPNTPQPCTRTVIEAKLCGVPKLILNDLVGVATFPEFKLKGDEFRKWIAESSYRFWIAVEASMPEFTMPGFIEPKSVL